MARFSPFDQTLWHATATPAPASEALRGRTSCDVCIVGGGYTGLTTALELKKLGLDVVVLEAQEAGFGGSGRNAGHCTPTFSVLSLPEVRSRLGAERAERLIRRQTSGADLAAELIQRYQIDCEWKQNGYFHGVLTKSAEDAVRRKAESYAAAGCPSGFIGASEAEALTGSNRFLGGWMLKSGGHLNPLSYARGLARAALQEGVRLHTRSPMIRCSRSGGRWQVETDQGQVTCERLIVATGAYTDGGGFGLEKTYKIFQALLAATPPLPEEIRAKVLPFDGTMHDGRGDIFVYKYDRAGRLIASMFPLGRRGRDRAYTQKVLMDRLRWLHPEIPENTGWDYYWAGELDMQRQTIPRLYRLGPGAIACTGLSGRGVPTGTMLGGILAGWAMETPEDQLALPIEPLKHAPAYMAAAPALMLRWYRFRDRIAAKMDGSELPPHA